MSLGRRRAALAALALLWPGVAVSVASCGDRTGLDLAFGDAGSPGPGVRDANGDDAGEDATDAFFGDVGFEDAGFEDAGFEDAGFEDAFFGDAGFEDASEDAPFVDAIAPFDAHVVPGSRLACPDGGMPTAYLFDDTGALYTFSPETLEAQLLGTPDCPQAALDSGPWTVSVSREGVAYLVYQDWNIYAVDLQTLKCKRTRWRPGELGLSSSFAIGVSRAAPTEQIFFYGQPDTGGGPIVASSDLTSFALTEIGPALPEPPFESGYDMQADLFGHLFVYSDDGRLTEVEASTATVTASSATGFPPESATSWAVMTYDADVYMFGGLEVARYDFTTHRAVVVGTIADGPTEIVGASAVPCSGSD